MVDHISPTTETLGATAKSAFDNPAFIEAVRETTDQIVREWAATSYDQVQLREQLWMKHHVFEDVINSMGGYILTAQAEKEMDAANKSGQQEPLDGFDIDAA